MKTLGLFDKAKKKASRFKERTVLALFLSFVVSFSYVSQSFASIYSDALEVNRTLPIQSNLVENWPQGPIVSAYSAILVDYDTGAILYDKNSHAPMYPASTTKLMTSILAMEKEGSNLNDLVSFSYSAISPIPEDASSMGMNIGNKMTLEECLYGILVCSANEVSNAVAEYVSGDIDTFVNLMNERAKELGCEVTHFTNAHGYCDESHVSSAYDLSLIAREFFKNELLSKMSRTPSYHWYPTEYQPEDLILGSTNYFLKGRYICDGIVGSKTGYTDDSRQVLVTCAERNGMRLIAVVMKDELPYQYEDTLSLLEYGFNNFEKLKVSDFEKKYTVTDEDFFHSNSAVFGDSSPILSIDRNSFVIVPKNLEFSDLNSSLVYSDDSDSSIATVYYDYKGVALGSADILYSAKQEKLFVFDKTEDEPDEQTEDENEPTFIYVNYIIYGIAAVFIVVFLIAVIVKVLSNYHFGGSTRPKSSFGKRKKRKGPKYKIELSGSKKKKGWKKRRSNYIEF